MTIDFGKEVNINGVLIVGGTMSSLELGFCVALDVDGRCTTFVINLDEHYG